MITFWYFDKFLYFSDNKIDYYCTESMKTCCKARVVYKWETLKTVLLIQIPYIISGSWNLPHFGPDFFINIKKFKWICFSIYIFLKRKKICSFKPIRGTKRKFWIKMVNFYHSVQAFPLFLIMWFRIRVRITDPDPQSSWIQIQFWSGSTTLVKYLYFFSSF